MVYDNKVWIYAFLKSFFVAEPSLEWLKRLRQPEALEQLKKMGVALSPEDLTESRFPQIKEDYTQLFIGPQKHISLNESIYTEKTPQFWGDAAVSSNRLIRELGLSLDENFNLMPDHIVVEFEIFQKLAERGKEALAENDQETAKKCRKYSRDFFLNHLAKWVPKVCDQIIDKAQTPFYREIGKFLKDFIRFEEKELSG